MLVFSFWVFIDCLFCVALSQTAINNSANAGLLAVRILAAHDNTLLQKMITYQKGLNDMVLQKADKLEREGWGSYQP